MDEVNEGADLDQASADLEGRRTSLSSALAGGEQPEAAEANRILTVDELLSESEAINYDTYNQLGVRNKEKLLFHLFSLPDRLPIFTRLLEGGMPADVRVKNNGTTYAFQLAVHKNDLELLRLFAEYGADLKYVDRDGRVPLTAMDGALQGQQDNPNEDYEPMIAYLKGQGVERARDIINAEKAQIEADVAKMAQANPGDIDYSGISDDVLWSFVGSVFFNDLDKAERLLENGFPVDRILEQETILMRAVRENNIDFVKLIAKYADINLVVGGGWSKNTVLDRALAPSIKQEIKTFLRKNGAKKASELSA